MQTFETYQEYYEYLFSEILEKEYNDPPIYGGGGRRFKDPKEMALKAIEYLVNAHNNLEVISMEGMRLYMKLWSNSAFQDYINVKQYTSDFKIVVWIIKNIIEKITVDNLYTRERFAASRFVLQCSWNWTPTERQLIEQSEFKVNINSKVTNDKEDDERGSDQIQED